jgi:parallel beta-helix repeat protein
MSFYSSAGSGDGFIIEGNKTLNSGKAGIALVSSPSNTFINANVFGNTIINPNALNESFGGGIRIYGSAGCSGNYVHGNRIVDYASKMKYGVHEWNDTNGNPTNNFIGPNIIEGSALIQKQLTLTTSTQVFDAQYESFTPTATASTGTITTSSASMKYKRDGKFIKVILTVTITTNGTGSGTVVITSPFSLVGGAMIGRESVVSGKAVIADVSGTSIYLRNYDNTYPGANGASIKLSGILELS